jgi:hypothetical protein
MKSVLAPAQKEAITVKAQIIQTGQLIDVSVLQDSGAEANLIHWKTVQRLRLPLIPLDRPVPITNVDLTTNKQEPLTAYTHLTLCLPFTDNAYHKEHISLYITDTAPHDIILSTPWLDLHNPDVNWQNNTVSVTRCPPSCRLINGPTVLRNFRKRTLKPLVEDDNNQGPTNAALFTPGNNDTLQINHLFIPDKDDNDNDAAHNVEVLLTSSQNITVEWVFKAVELACTIPNFAACTFETGDVILYTDDYTEDNDDSIAIRAGFTKSQELAEAAFAATKQKAYNEIVPEAYRNYDNVFSKQASKRKPKFRPFDHAIDLKPGFEPKPCKLYPLSPSEQVALNEWLKEHLEKGYIRPSKSPMASPFFFVKKKDGSLCPIQDYWYLNSGTIKNAYPLPLIGKLINQLKGTCIFSKFDIRWGYPNMHIKEGDK